jgi:integrase
VARRIAADADVAVLHLEHLTMEALRAAFASWPERDLALVATFCVTGIREGEAVALTMASLEGTPGARRLQVAGKGGKTRAIPIEGGLEEVLGAYLATRRARFGHHDLDHPATPLFVDVRGRGLSVDQVKYLIDGSTSAPGCEPGCRPGPWCTPCATPSATRASWSCRPRRDALLQPPLRRDLGPGRGRAGQPVRRRWTHGDAGFLQRAG